MGAPIAIGQESPGITEHGEKTGLSIELSAEQEQEIFELVSDLSDLGFDIKDNAFFLLDEDSTTVVLTDRQPQTGSAHVEGQVFDLGSEFDIVIAGSVSFDTTGEPVSLSEFRDDPQAYEYSHVRVEGYIQQVPVAFDAQLRDPQAWAMLSEERPPMHTGEVGTLARFNSVQLSGSEIGGESLDDLETILGTNHGSVAAMDQSPGTFWIDGYATVDLVVTSGYPPSVYVSAVDVHSETQLTSDELAATGDQYIGEVVTVEADATGTSTSSKDYLTTVAPCGDDGVVVGVTPPGCLPVVTDSTMHTGVLFDGVPAAQNEVIAYAGLSNTAQSVPTELEEGRYQVTGRVVSTAQLDSSLSDGYGLVVHDRDRIGDSSVRGDATERAEEFADEVTAAFQSQLETDSHDGEFERQIVSNEPLEVDPDGNDGTELDDTQNDSSTDVETVVFVTDAELLTTNVTVSDPIRVRATIINTAGDELTRDIPIELGSGVVHNELVTVDEHSETTVTITTPHNRTSTGSARVRADLVDAGTVYFESSSNGSNDSQNGNNPSFGAQTTTHESNDDTEWSLPGLSAVQSTVLLTAGGFGAFAGGAVLALLAFVAELKRYYQDAPFKPRKINIGFGIGLFGVISGSLILGFALDSELWLLSGFVLGVVVLLSAWLYLAWQGLQWSLQFFE
ncbi:hypothetical protein [Natronoglomus mannanivorans]|uniref:Uncharacterized protein n=1 Tax=Natronoglomus mannanivorans TaxID=2979990 RepID=A0AAP3E240_9EURY|nr:hypothetical protein [Halobacteria archaeon AArc-xg1-1]